jgi:hypothetical protein
VSQPAVPPPTITTCSVVRINPACAFVLISAYFNAL